jgi:hypothetical protein
VSRSCIIRGHVIPYVVDGLAKLRASFGSGVLQQMGPLYFANL